MSKTLQTAALVVGAVALAATGVGALAGAGLAFTGLSAAGLAAAAGVATVATIGTIALEVGASLLAPHATAGGSATKFKADPLAGIPYVMGRTINAGNIIYRRTYNTPGYGLPDLQSFVVDLSGAGPIDGIEKFWSDKPNAVYDASNTLIASTDPTVNFDAAGNAIGFFNSWMFQTTQLGATPQTSVLAKTYGGVLPPDWTGSSKLSGHAAAMWTLRYDQKGKVYTNGVPEPSWILRGVKVYDPRRDSTYPGGSGSCRALVESTYVYSENPYLHGLTWCLGRWQNGKRILGVGAPVAGIDVATFVEGANVADANGWKVGGVIYSTDNKWNVLKSILQAGGGEPMHLGARISCFINTPRVVLDTVTYADVAGEVSVAATKARRDRINAITGTYRSEAHQWEVIPASPITVDPYVTVDGGLRMKNVDYPLVQQLTQMAQLVRYDIENAREFEPVTLPLKLRWVGYKPGDCIAVTLPESGLVAQPVLIRNRNLDAESGLVTLTARSETAGKHPFALGQTGVAPPTPTVTGPPLVPAPTDGAWAITAVGLTAGTTTIPALVITGAATNIAIDNVLFEYRVWTSGMADDAGWIAAGTELPTTTRTEITALMPATQYEAAVSYRLHAVVGPRSILGPVTTAALLVPGSEGVPGATGPAGATLYTWVAYANAPDGSVDFSTGTPNGRVYQGIAVNQASATEGINPAAYTWSLYVGPATYGLVTTGYAIDAGTTVIKNGGSGDNWDSSAYSDTSYLNGAFANFTNIAGAGGVFIGLSRNPAENSSYETIDFAWYLDNTGVYSDIRSRGITIATMGAYSGDWTFSVEYDGGTGNILFFRNNALVYTYAWGVRGAAFYLDSSLFRNGARFTVAGFGPTGATGDPGAAGTPGAAGASGTNGVNGTNGAPGAPGSSAVVQGSADGFSFHTGITTGDIYARFSNDSGASFGAPVRVKGDQGVPGGGGVITTTGAAIPNYVPNGATRNYILQLGSATSSAAGSFHVQLLVDGAVYDNGGNVQPYGTDGPAQSYLSGTYTNTGAGRVVSFSLGRSSGSGFVLDPSQTYLTV